MAGRILNRRALREEAAHAQVGEGTNATVAEVPPKKKSKTGASVAVKARKPRAKKPPPRMCARWGVFDAAMKQVAIFNYNERAAADEKLADLLAKKKGSYFLQIVREQMAEPAAVAVVAVG